MLLLNKHKFPLTTTTQSYIIKAALLRVEEKDRGGIKEIKRNNYKVFALEEMFKLITFLSLSKKEASERAAYHCVTRFPHSKIKATSLYKDFNKYKEKTPLNYKFLSDDEFNEIQKKWSDVLEHNYPMPPDGHWCIGE